MRTRVAAVLLLCLSACGPLFKRGTGAESSRTTLCVVNATVAYGSLTARAGLVRFDVMPGEEVCKPVIATGGDIVLRAQTIGGGASGPRRYAERLPAGGYRCWRWRLTDSPASSGDLFPCEATDDEEPASDDDDPPPADTTGSA